VDRRAGSGFLTLWASAPVTTKIIVKIESKLGQLDVPVMTLFPFSAYRVADSFAIEAR
jgi:hypothetical protein